MVPDSQPAAETSRIVESKTESKDKIYLSFQIKDGDTGKFVDGWSAQIQKYRSNNKIDIEWLSSRIPAKGEPPTVTFELNSGELLPPNHGYAVFVTRHKQDDFILDMVDYLERPSVSRTIIYEFD